MCLDLYDVKSLSLNWTPFKRRCFGWTACPWALYRNTKCPGLCWTWGQTSSRMDSFYMLLLFWSSTSALWATTVCCFCNNALHRKVLAWLGGFPMTHTPVPTIQLPCWPVSLPTVRHSSLVVTGWPSDSKWPSWFLLTSGTLGTPQRKEDETFSSYPPRIPQRWTSVAA